MMSAKSKCILSFSQLAVSVMSSTDSEANAVTESPVRSGNGRRRSFLDVGGANSLNNFASAHRRMSEYLDHRLEDETIEIGDENEQSEMNGNTFNNYSSISLEPFTESNRTTARGNAGSSLLLEQTILRRSSLSRNDNDISGMFANKSTAPQTIFNSINTLMGIGMLSLPYALKLSGWILGSILFALLSIVTCFTAKILAKALHAHPNTHTYGDIALVSFGKKVQILVTFIFTCDLIGAALSLIILFSDCFEQLTLGRINGSVFKLIIIILILFSSYLPLLLLSFSSLLGIICVSGIILLSLVVGVATGRLGGGQSGFFTTQLWPSDFWSFALAIGIFMAPWGGHVVFPELYRDMRHPEKFNSCANVSFFFTWLLNFFLAATTYLMFGENIEDTFTKNLMNFANERETDQKTFFEVSIQISIALLMGTLALVKAPLVVRPVFSVVEKAAGIDSRALHIPSIRSLLIRVTYCSFLLCMALTVKLFGDLMAFLGSAICFTICVIFPLLFLDSLFEVKHRYLLRVGIFISCTLAAIGTVAVMH